MEKVIINDYIRGEPLAEENLDDVLDLVNRIRLSMLMYGKEASNRKQEIDRQHHTIPNQRSQRPKDKHCGNVYNWLWNHG